MKTRNRSRLISFTLEGLQERSTSSVCPYSQTRSPRILEREFVFETTISSMLNEDAEFTTQYIEVRARQLLSGLRYFRQFGAQRTRRAIIVVAYDIGAIVFKQAVSIASAHDSEYDDIFTSIARIVFVGCFQRGDERQLGLKVLTFLNVDHDAEWVPCVTLLAVQNLVSAIRASNGAFLGSKISLRSRIFSLYAGPSGKRIHWALDHSTATLGLSTELSLQEKSDGLVSEAFPSLAENICDSIDSWRLLEPSKVALERTVMYLVPPEVQMLSKSPSRAHPVLSSSAHQSWFLCPGIQLLLLDGPDTKATTEAAEQIGLDWVRKQQSIYQYYPRFVQFRFSSSDPLRNSMAPMCAACILHFSKLTTLDTRLSQQLLQDQYKLQNAWTDDDLLRLALRVGLWMETDTPLILHGLDECEPRSRRRFLAMLSELASKSEEPFKIILTASKPGMLTAKILRDELKTSTEVKLLEYTVAPEDITDTHANEEGKEVLLARLVPKDLPESSIRTTLERLDSLSHGTLPRILRIAETYSKWPEEQSRDNLIAFIDIIEGIQPLSTPGDILSKILRSLPDQEWLGIVLAWILSAQRPLTLMELSAILSFGTNGDISQWETSPDDETIQQNLRQIKKRIRGFLYLDGDQTRIRSDVLELLDKNAEEYWETIKKRAPENTAKFLLEYLRLPATQERLNDLYRRYEERLQRSGDAITPPISTDGRDIIFYAVHALPHHLSNIKIPAETEDRMRDPSGPYRPWAQVYWAMSNPFSRAPKGPSSSAWSAWRSSAEFGPPNLVMLRAADEEDGNETSIQGILRAVRANNEDLALILAEEVVSAVKSKSTTPQETIRFPPPVLWRATWLGMDRLLEFLLRCGEQPDDQSAASSPSLLYMASRLGFSKIVHVLLNHNADLRVRDEEEATPLSIACSHGHIDVVKMLLEKDPTMLDIPQPDTPLYTAALWGSWDIVELLLRLGADPNLTANGKVPNPSNDDLYENKWTPITAACDEGFLKTVRSLLTHDADPNTTGPSGYGTCLWFAAIEASSVEMVEMLLEHGADANHQILDPPILMDIIKKDRIPEKTKIEICELLIRHDPPVDLDRRNAHGRTPLMIAGIAGNQAAVQWLLDKGASIDAIDSGNHSVLFHAVVEQNWDVVHHLLNHREKPRLNLVCSHGQTLLEIAMNNIDELKILLKAGADPNFLNNRQQTLLNVAVAGCRTEVVKYLLESDRHMDVHHRDKMNWSPIMDAAGYAPQKEIAQMLMESGASLLDTTPTGYSPLHLAAAHARPDILQVLLEFHTHDDLMRRSTDGRTPLLAVHDLLGEESLECIRLLVRAGSDINAQDSKGETLLTRSARFGQNSRHIQNWLLARPKIDVHCKTAWGLTALHHACAFGDIDLVNMLIHKGADVNVTGLNFRSMPLFAACLPVRRFHQTDNVPVRLEDAERIVRTLAARGADVTATKGISLFTALCAAALCAGVGTINFLLDKSASVRSPDPLGRLPIHFAAANGIRNFETIVLAHGEDIMIPDNFKKNALHWAAQFGNAETVKAILQKLSPKEKRIYVNFADADGWTPLAWASRQTEPSTWVCWTKSEPQDYEATMKCLIGHGADISVTFHMSQGVDAEELTPLKMAKRSGFGEAVIQLLTPKNVLGKEASEEPMYTCLNDYCNFCLSQCRGIIHECDICDKDRYIVCSKCYPTALVEHHIRRSSHLPYTGKVQAGIRGSIITIRHIRFGCQ